MWRGTSNRFFTFSIKNLPPWLTDGLNEAENVHHQQFGDEQVLSMAKELLENGESQPMPFVQRMAAAVRFFAGAAEQSDDLTMLAIQYKKEGE